MLESDFIQKSIESLPTRGAWIEISEYQYGYTPVYVAPHTGSDKFVHRYVP